MTIRQSTLFSLFFSAPLLLLPGCQGPRFRSGLDVLASDDFAPLRGRRVGVVTNPTGVDRRLRSVIDLLADAPDVELVAIFGPEHGVRSAREAGVKVGSEKDARTGVPVFSLYGKTRRPTEEMLDGIDVVLFDIQDIGVRTYTYMATLVHVLEASAEHGVAVWVLDRPVPIGGHRLEGPVLEPEHASFVGPHAVPLRHGLTAGEFARMVNAEQKIGADLHVVKMEGYRRESRYEETDTCWIAPSPNIPTVDSALVYAGMVLLEGTNISEGRGTTRPFHLVGAPWIDGGRLAGELNRLELAGVLFREAYFVPNFSKYQGEMCRGVEMYVRDWRVYDSVTTTIAFLELIRRLHPDAFSFREAGFDRLAGTQSLRTAIENGVPYQEIVNSWQSDLRAYEERRKAYLLYD